MATLLRKLPKRHRLIISCCVFITIFIALLPAEKASAYRNTQYEPLVIGKAYSLTIPTHFIEKETTSEQNLQYQEQIITVKRGDNLAKIFKALSFSPQVLHQIINLKQGKKLKSIHPGDQLYFKFQHKKLLSITYPIDPIETLYITWQEEDERYQAILDTKKIETRIQVSAAIIDSNFWTAGIFAGLSDNQIMNFANVFGWDIDFANDIRTGDRFSLIYEQYFVEGELFSDGPILAAQITNQSELFQAIRAENGQYYTPQGVSVRKAFLRAPVNFKYVSSNFNPRRYHPILKRYKAHNGVDYVAPKGTPVVAAGKGTVTQSAYNKYNGHYVFIKHKGGVTTKYLHFTKRAVKKGQRIRQGQVIGYVGSTGLAQAPHLHYEFIINGVHTNPRTVKLPKSPVMPVANRKSFQAHSQKLLSQLNQQQHFLLAAR